MSTAASRNALDGANTKRIIQVDSSGVEWQRIPTGSITSTGVQIASGGATAMSSTLAAAAGKTTRLGGFAVTGLGATLGSSVLVTVTGLVTGTQNFVFGYPTGVAVPAAPLILRFNPPIPASVPSQAVIVNVPALGSGSVAAAVSAWGDQQ